MSPNIGHSSLAERTYGFWSLFGLWRLPYESGSGTIGLGLRDNLPGRLGRVRRGGRGRPRGVLRGERSVLGGLAGSCQKLTLSITPVSL